jgi:hypothetical protein
MKNALRDPAFPLAGMVAAKLSDGVVRKVWRVQECK